MRNDGRRPPADPRGRSAPSQSRVPHEDDFALFHRMAAGDESALAALYDKWGSRVHTVAFWILQDADEAEDVVEETFWQAWRSAATFDGRRGAGSTWLLMITRSRALDRLRCERRRGAWLAAPSTLNALLDGPGVAGTDLPGAQAERMEFYTELAAALAALPPEQREVMEMAFFGGLSHAQIAAQSAQPLGTVKTRIRLAMQKLRQRLAFLREESS
jgi:RNA polymerase sigma-70 factor, ECF subfamily